MHGGGVAHANCEHFLTTFTLRPDLFAWGELDGKGDLLRHAQTPLTASEVDAIIRAGVV